MKIYKTTEIEHLQLDEKFIRLSEILKMQGSDILEDLCELSQQYSELTEDIKDERLHRN